MSKFWILLVLVFETTMVAAQFKYYEQGMDAYKNKDYDQAIKNLNAYMDYSMRDKSFDVDVHYYMGLSYFKTNSFTSAIREFDHAIEQGHKNSGNIYWFMAKAYAELRVPKESVTSYTKALDLIKDNVNQSKILFERSQQYTRLGDAENSKKDLTQSLALNSSNDEARGALAQLTKGNDIAMGEQKVIVTSQPPDARSIKVAKNEEAKKGSEIKPEVNKTLPGNTPPVIAASQPTSNTEEKRNSQPDKKSLANQNTPPPVVAVPPSVPAEPTLADLYKDEKRYALVIGNSNYKYVAPLKNAANDASDMADELAKSNFEVIKVINGSYDEMREAYRKFQDKLINGPKDQTIGLFYYAGHGLQNEGENYLVPVEANIKYEDDIPRTCFAVQRVVVANMERSNSRMNIIILDACRNNPFPSAYRSTSSGLAELNRAKGSFVAFATAPGSVASDGDGRNGLYTQELLKAMRKPGRTIEQVFKDVRYNVMKLSDDKQYTWDQSNIIGDFYFKFQ